MSAASGAAFNNGGIGGSDAVDKIVAADSDDKADRSTDLFRRGNAAKRDRNDGGNEAQRRADETRSDHRDNDRGHGNRNLNRENRSQTRTRRTQVVLQDQSLLPACLGE